MGRTDVWQLAGIDQHLPVRTPANVRHENSGFRNWTGVSKANCVELIRRRQVTRVLAWPNEYIPAVYPGWPRGFLRCLRRLCRLGTHQGSVRRGRIGRSGLNPNAVGPGSGHDCRWSGFGTSRRCVRSPGFSIRGTLTAATLQRVAHADGLALAGAAAGRVCVGSERLHVRGTGEPVPADERHENGQRVPGDM